jgi:hypothetical protein
MRAIEVIYYNGKDTKKVGGSINGTNESISEYYLGKCFNFGIEGDDMYKAIAVYFCDTEKAEVMQLGVK